MLLCVSASLFWLLVDLAQKIDLLIIGILSSWKISKKLEKLDIRFSKQLEKLEKIQSIQLWSESIVILNPAGSEIITSTPVN